MEGGGLKGQPVYPLTSGVQSYHFQQIAFRLFVMGGRRTVVTQGNERTNDITAFPRTESNSPDSPYPRLEYAILGVLLNYEGKYEETFSDWYLALKLIEPRLVHPRQLIEVFDRLSAAGIVQVFKGDLLYSGQDSTFFLGTSFRTVLITHGVVQLSTLKLADP